MPLDFPASPTNGQLYPPAPNALYIYNATAGGPSVGAWESLPMESAKTITADVAPFNPADGDQWFSTIDGVLYIWVVDVDGGQWVESAAPISANGYYSPNYVINGGFDIWQRGTSIAPGLGYTADRWYSITSPTATIARSTVSGGSVVPESILYQADITGSSVGAAGYSYFDQRIENVNTTAGRVMTLSFYAKGSASGTIGVTFGQNFGSGGSSDVVVLGSNVNITTSWQRFTVSVTMPSVIGKTIGANNFSQVRFIRGLGTNYTPATFGIPALVDYTGTLSITGVQLEEGSTATTFRRNANSLQGELAACQRYYFRASSTSVFSGMPVVNAGATNSTTILAAMSLPVPLRTAPTSIEASTLRAVNLQDNASVAVTGVALSSAWSNVNAPGIVLTVGSGLTANALYRIGADANVNGYLALNAEL